MVKDGQLNLDFDDEVTKATVITYEGNVVSEPVRKLLDPAPRDAPVEPTPSAGPGPTPEPSPVPEPSPSQTPAAPGGNA